MNTNQNSNQKAQGTQGDSHAKNATNDHNHQDTQNSSKNSSTGKTDQDIENENSEPENPSKEHNDKGHQHESKIPVAGSSKEKEPMMKEDHSETKATSGTAQGKVNLDSTKQDHQKSSI